MAEVRAKRFAVQAPVRYRKSAGGWRQGITENISLSGLLVRGEELIEPGMSIEMIVDLPPRTPGEFSGRIFCRGQTVRTVPPSPAAPSGLFAAAVEHYRFGQAKPRPLADKN